jgi:NAD(P)H dehydrogenase (quinone)
MGDVLVLYYSRYGATAALAREVARGVDSVSGMSARLRTVPAVSAVTEATQGPVPDDGPPYATLADLDECTGLVLGSPTRFGNMAASLKYFLDSTGADWLKGTLSGKPAGVFTSSSSLHGGQESTLLTMAVPLLHHGMFLVGLPYTLPEIGSTTSGGSPYGATHVTWSRDADRLDPVEIRLARALGSRVAALAQKLDLASPRLR